MPKLRPDGCYICTRDEIETLLYDICMTVADAMGPPLNEAETLVMRQGVALVITAWLQHVGLVIPASEDS